MKKDDRVTGDQGDLRRHAEERVLAAQPEVSGAMSEDQVKALVHELQVHQIELEMQNEELRLARCEAEALKEQYLDLYDFAPVGYFTFDIQGTILSVNLTGAGLLGESRSALVGRRFQVFLSEASRVSFSECLSSIIRTNEKCTFEASVEREGRAPVFLQIEGVAVESPDGKEKLCRAAIMDVTERRKTEAREKELERHKLEFYRRMILTATDGKLVITDTSEIERLVGAEIASWDIHTFADPAIIRHAVSEAALAAGMDESRVWEFIFAIGEAITNAIKHGGGGTASLHRMRDALILVISDKGPGIAALSLPDIALARNYSTAGTLGIGYKLMIRVADKVYLATTPGGTVVGLEMGLQPPKALSLLDSMPAASLA